MHQRQCQRPGCKNIVKGTARFCKESNCRALDKRDKLRAARANDERILKRLILKLYGDTLGIADICPCANCNGSCRKRRGRKPRAGHDDDAQRE